MFVSIQTTPHADYRSGFSLVELALVIVIIGLIAGGIIGGQSLLRNSAVNAIGIEITQYSDAIYRFRKQYAALPGDMPDATRYWGAANATAATCRTTVTNSNLTCNGNGDGQLTDITGSNEPYRAWQHLVAAEMITGTYSGVHGATADSSITGTNVPENKLTSSAGFSLRSSDASSGAAAAWDSAGGIFITFGNERVNGITDREILTPSEQWSLDRKYDDELPQSGRFISRKNQAGCATSTNMATARYNLTVDSEECILELYTKRDWRQ